jgi:hypothetical protein
MASAIFLLAWAAFVRQGEVNHLQVEICGAILAAAIAWYFWRNELQHLTDL